MKDADFYTKQFKRFMKRGLAFAVPRMQRLSGRYGYGRPGAPDAPRTLKERRKYHWRTQATAAWIACEELGFWE